MENLLNEIIETITVILGWFKTIRSQFSEFIINANEIVDLKVESIWQMLITPEWYALLMLPITALIVGLLLKAIFRK